MEGLRLKSNVIRQTPYGVEYLSQGFARRGPRRASGKTNSLFEQSRGIVLNRASAGGGLTGEFSLNLGSDINGDCHGHLSTTYPTAALVSKSNTATLTSFKSGYQRAQSTGALTPYAEHNRSN